MPLQVAEVGRAAVEQALGQGDIAIVLDLAEGEADAMDVVLPPEGFCLFQGAGLLSADQDGADRQGGHSRNQEHPDPYGRGPVPPAPPRQPRGQRLPIQRDRLVGEPALEVVGQRAR
jgi:hypothetical protein